MWNYIKQFFISLLTPDKKQLVPIKVLAKQQPRPLHSRQMKISTKHK